MTRRLALAILLTVWGMLLVGGVSTYYAVQSVLLADLDAVLFARAAGLPELYRPAGATGIPPIPQYDWRDTYVVQEDADRAGATAKTAPRIVDRRIESVNGDGRIRHVVVEAWAEPKASMPARPVKVDYSGSMQSVDGVLRKLALALLAIGAATGAVAALVAMLVSRLALRPLRDATKVIEVLDADHLEARVSTRELPVEFLGTATRLNELLDRLAVAFAQRRQFLANASHELRTPVAALVTTLELASRQPRDPAAYRQAIDRSLKDVQHLRRLVEQLMEHARGEITAAMDKVRETDVVALVNQCAQLVTEASPMTEGGILLRLPASLRCLLEADRLRSIVMNLLGNAVEYGWSPQGIEVVALHDGQQLRLSVRDHGSGIAPDHIGNLFEPFYRVDKMHAQARNHLGLGLFLVRSHVMAMNGEYRVESTAGTGTTFYIDIPCATPENRPEGQLEKMPEALPVAG